MSRIAKARRMNKWRRNREHDCSQAVACCEPRKAHEPVFESLEQRQMLSADPLLALAPEYPLVSHFNVGGIEYDASTDQFSLRADPQILRITDSQLRVITATATDFQIDLQIAEDGTLVGGTLNVYGTVDDDGNPGTPALTGLLLSGNAKAYGANDTAPGSTPGTDEWDFLFELTGGALSTYYTGKDIYVSSTSEASTFANDLSVNFSGHAKGSLGGITIEEEPPAGAIALEKYVRCGYCFDVNNLGYDADTAAEAVDFNVGGPVLYTYVVTNTGDQALANVTLVDDAATPGDTSDDFAPSAVLSGGFNIGDLDQDNQLDVDEVWYYVANTSAKEGLHTNIAVVTADLTEGPAGQVTDTDPANYVAEKDKCDPKPKCDWDWNWCKDDKKDDCKDDKPKCDWTWNWCKDDKKDDCKKDDKKDDKYCKDDKKDDCKKDDKKNDKYCKDDKKDDYKKDDKKKGSWCDPKTSYSGSISKLFSSFKCF